MTNYLIGLYGILCVAHLYLCAAGKYPTTQDITKYLLMPTLLGTVLSTGNCTVTVAAALFLGWIGDILLTRPQKKVWFLGGLVSFLAGHACYIAAMIPRGSYPMRESILTGGILIILGAGAYATLHHHVPTEMRGAVLAYLLVILGMAFTALRSGEWLLISGAVCFVISDYILSRSLFIERKKWSSFVIMLTYLGAQFCLSFGLVGI